MMLIGPLVTRGKGSSDVGHAKLAWCRYRVGDFHLGDRHMFGSKNKTWGSIVLLGAACLLGGCSYSNKAEVFMKPYELGQYDLAATAVDQVVGPVKDDKSTPPDKLLKVDHRDAVVFRLEQGAIYRVAGRWDDSVLAFNHADQLMQEYDQQPDVKVSREIGAAVVNQTVLEYRGYSYDRLAVELYQALNYMQTGRLDEARMALRAMQQRQVDAEDHFRKKIDSLEAKDDSATPKTPSSQDAQEDPNKPKRSVDVEKIRNDPKVMQSFKTVYGDDVNVVPDRTAYKAYSNPFGEYLQGIYFMSAALDASDLETAATAFKRVRGMLPSNGYVAQDCVVSDMVASGAPLPPTTYVLFETGRAPMRETIRIDIPIFIVNAAWRDTGVDYVGAAFPKLKFHDNYVHCLTATAGGTSYQTEVLTDMDEVVKRDFNNELPVIITRTIISTATKAAIAYAANKATDQNSYVNILTRIATTVYQIAANQADLRTWETLPKQFQVARFPTPEDRQLTMTLADGMSLPPIALTEGEVNIVYVKSVQPGVAPSIQQFKLK